MLKFSTYVERKYLRAAGLGTALGVAAYGAGQLMNDKTPQPTQIQPQIQQVIPEPIEKPLLVRKNVDETAYFAKYIGANEGSRKQVYIDGRGHPTIGIGHLITPQSRDLFTKLFNNSIDFDALLQKREQLTEPQVQILFQHDLKRHLDVAKRVLPHFDNYPIYLKAALLDATYRGDLGTKTTALINQNQWDEAAIEYLNRKDYRNRIQLGIPGIGPRMERNRDAMLRYAAESRNQAGR